MLSLPRAGHDIGRCTLLPTSKTQTKMGVMAIVPRGSSNTRRKCALPVL